MYVIAPLPLPTKFLTKYTEFTIISESVPLTSFHIVFKPIANQTRNLFTSFSGTLASLPLPLTDVDGPCTWTKNIIPSINLFLTSYPDFPPIFLISDICFPF